MRKRDIFYISSVLGMLILGCILTVNFLQTDYNRDMIIYTGFIPQMLSLYLTIAFGFWVFINAIFSGLFIFDDEKE